MNNSFLFEEGIFNDFTKFGSDFLGMKVDSWFMKMTYLILYIPTYENWNIRKKNTKTRISLIVLFVFRYYLIFTKYNYI